MYSYPDTDRRDRMHTLADRLNPVRALLLCMLAAGAIAAAEDATLAGVTRIAIVEGADPTEQGMAGSYDKDTLGVEGGIIKGSGAGTPNVEIGGIRVGTSIPILTIPGAIAGGIYGKAQQEQQEFRDALADDLAGAASQPLTNSLLALHVYQSVRSLPGLDVKLFAAAAPVPEETEAVLYVRLRDIVIDVQGKDAVLKTTAQVELQRRDGGLPPDKRWYYYQDSDTLANWTKNDNALWHDYANFARHYLGREIATDVLSGARLRYELHPVQSADVSTRGDDAWQGASKSRTPSLAWQLTLPGQDPQNAWADELGDSEIDFDIEVYDAHRLVYARERIPDPVHRLESALDKCETYRWSVRPVYHHGDRIRYGEWMRMTPTHAVGLERGIVGSDASSGPAYTKDFASLKIDCRAK